MRLSCIARPESAPLASRTSFGRWASARRRTSSAASTNGRKKSNPKCLDTEATRTAKAYCVLPPCRGDAPRPGDRPPFRDARAGGQIVRENRPFRRVAETDRGIARDRARGRGSVEAQSSPRGGSRQASDPGAEDIGGNRDPRTRGGETSVRPLGRR